MNRSETTTFPRVRLDRTSKTPLHRQIHDQLAMAIREGHIGNNSRLPSTRVLAQLLGVSRNTVSLAYEELVADGAAVAKGGSGVRIDTRTPAPVFELAGVLRDAHYPAKLVYFNDPDGNSIPIN